MNEPSYFEIQADDCERAKDFYEKVFAWKFSKDEKLPVEYWRIETKTSRGGLLKRPAPASMGSGTNAYVCSTETKNYDETAKIILDVGGQIALPKFAVPGICYQGYFLDTENNTFGLFEPNPSAK